MIAAGWSTAFVWSSSDWLLGEGDLIATNGSNHQHARRRTKRGNPSRGSPSKGVWATPAPMMAQARPASASSRHIAGIFMNIAGNLTGRAIGTALHLKCTDFAVELGCAIAKHVAVVHGAGGVQHLAAWADVNAAPPVPAKVSARECAVIALAGVTDRNMRRNPVANQPAEETASSISGVSSKPLRLQTKATFGSIKHRLCAPLNIFHSTDPRRIPSRAVGGLLKFAKPANVPSFDGGPG